MKNFLQDVQTMLIYKDTFKLRNTSSILKMRFGKTLNSRMNFLELCKSFITEDTISLHIRRGDYVTNPNHPTQDVSYYEAALAKLPEDIPVIVFSDDPAWCNEQSMFEDDRFMIAEGNSTDCDLCLMSLCKYHIIANSSYSWWGAWLAKSERVIAPKNWFGGECVNKSTEDMMFDNFEFL